MRMGGGLCHSIERMFWYHSGALSGLPAYDATTCLGRAMTIEVSTSTRMYAL